MNKKNLKNIQHGGILHLKSSDEFKQEKMTINNVSMSKFNRFFSPKNFKKLIQMTMIFAYI